MTVEELIKALYELPSDLIVVTLDGMPIEGVQAAESRTITGTQEVVIF